MGHFGLPFQLIQVGIQFAQDVVNAGQVFTRVRQAVFRLASALFVFGHTRGFFQKHAKLFGARLDDAADRALADDGVSAWTQTGAQKHILHISAAHRLVVDVITAVAVAGQHTLDGDLCKLTPLTTGAVVIVVKDQLDAGAAGGFSGSGAVENHVLHGLTTQFRRLGLAQHPAHRIHDVGFAATVGANHAHQLPGQQKVGRFSKRFEASKFDGIETHGGLVDPKKSEISQGPWDNCQGVTKTLKKARIKELNP